MGLLLRSDYVLTPQLSQQNEDTHLFWYQFGRKRSDLMQKNINIKKSGSHLRRGGSIFAERWLCAADAMLPSAGISTRRFTGFFLEILCGILLIGIYIFIIFFPPINHCEGVNAIRKVLAGKFISLNQKKNRTVTCPVGLFLLERKKLFFISAAAYVEYRKFYYLPVIYRNILRMPQLYHLYLFHPRPPY